MQAAQNNVDQYIVEPPQSQYFDFSSEYVPSVYVVLPQAGWRAITSEEEATDKEILLCLEKSGHFDFLKNPEEDIYKPTDGEPV